MAHDAGKPLVADEVWLHKGATSAQGNVDASNQQGAINTYSLWEPLDVKFLAATREWAQKAGVPLISGLWSWQTLAYNTWPAELAAKPPPQILIQSDQLVSRPWPAAPSPTPVPPSWAADLAPTTLTRQHYSQVSRFDLEVFRERASS